MTKILLRSRFQRDHLLREEDKAPPRLDLLEVEVDMAVGPVLRSAKPRPRLLSLRGSKGAAAVVPLISLSPLAR
jgi:hypothetical protein